MQNTRIGVNTYSVVAHHLCAWSNIITKKNKSVMDKKTSFRKSLLSSAIIAATLQTLSAASQAATCPAPNASGNVHVGVGDFCEGGITVDAGFGPVNDIGIQGRVNGNVLVDDGISDFWMSAGELNGSFINNDVMRDLNIDNGSNVFSDIQNNGDMRFLTVSDDPGVPTVIHGNISNDGNITRVHITGSRALVKGNVISSSSATIAQDLIIDNGATVEGNVINHGSMGEIWVKGARIGGDLTNTAGGSGVAIDDGAIVGGTFSNDGNVFGVGVLDGSTVVGDFINSGDVFVFTAQNDTTVEGNMVNTGNAVIVHVGDGSHVAGDLVNRGFVDGVTMADGASVAGAVVNEVDGFTDGLLVINGSSVEAVLNEGVTRYIAIDSSDVATDVTNNGSVNGIVSVADGSTIGGNLVNNGSINPSDTEPSFGPFFDGASTMSGIEVTNGSAVAGAVINNGDITLDFVDPLSDGFAPMQGASLAGISVNNGSHGGRIINDGTITVTNGQAHDSGAFLDGAQVNGIEVTRGSTADTVMNDGMIVADTFGILVDGSGNDGVTVNGDVVNAAGGGILSQDNGIFIRNARVEGNIQNDGSINSSEDNAIDIQDSWVSGSVINTGSLTSNDDYDVIDIDDSHIEGDVFNTSNVTGEDGIDIDDSTVAGTVENTGTINAVDEGFDIDQSDISENLVNSGLINAGRVGIFVEGEMDMLPPPAPGEAPVSVIDYVTVGGSFINSGDIVSGETGIYMRYVDIAGDFDSSGSIEAGLQNVLPDDGEYFHGIDLESVKVGNNVVLGEISALDNGARVNGVTVGGDIIGNGSISGTQGDALSISGSSIAGNLINQGVLSAGNDGIDLSDTTIDVDFINNGDITAGDGSGIAMGNNITIDGSFKNAGNITADDFGIILEGKRFLDDGNQLVTENIAAVGGDFINSGVITTATKHGIHIVDATIGGKVHNTGDITTNNKYAINIEGSSQVGGDVFNSGELTGNKGIRLVGSARLEDGQLVSGEVVTVAGVVVNEGIIHSSNDAIRITGAEIGGLVNAGDIDNTGSDAIDIDNAIIHGNIENSGLITTTTNDAIDLENTIVHGSIINSGRIDSTGVEGIDINSNTLVTGHIINKADGVMIADSDPLIIGNAEIQGSIINDGLIIARQNDAIQVDDSFVGGSVINNGTLRAGDNAFELDGQRNKPVVIAGNLENRGQIFAIRGDGVTNGGDDAFDIDDLEVRGNVINTGTIVAGGEAYEIDRMTIGGNWANTGAITAGEDAFDVDGLQVTGDWLNSSTIIAGENAYLVEGNRQWHEAEETPDGVTPGYYSLAPTTIGGRFVNEGDIEAGNNGIVFDLVSIGTNGVLEDGLANFESRGDILAKDGSAIDLRATSVAGDFVNTGDLTARQGPDFVAGDYYYHSPQAPLPDGQVVLSALGEDQQSNAWFSIKNETGNNEWLVLKDEAGNFSESFFLTGGQEVIVNTGDLPEGASFVLTRDGGPGPGPGPGPQPDGQIAVGTVDLNAEFSPPYHIDNVNSYFRGISLTGKLYDEGGEHEQLVRSAIGGDLVNAGAISAVDQGIYIRDADIAGHMANSGDITSLRASGIDIADATIGGSVINAGNIDAGTGVFSQEGDNYRGQWQGKPTNDGEILLEATGRDKAGNAWFVVRNESNTYYGAHLQEQNGDFSTQYFNIAPGEEVYVNAGQLEGDLDLSYPGSDGLIATATADNGRFMPKTEPQYGISLVDVTVNGGVENSGVISAISKGIYVADSTLSGSVINGVDGVITVERSEDGRTVGIELDDVEGVGSFVNRGTITLLDDGWGAGMTATDVYMDGVAGNTGTINSNGFGIALFDVDGATGLVNEGTINAEIPGLFAVDSSIDGDIVNHAGAVINTNYDGIFLGDVRDADNLANHGTINVAMGDGITVFDTDFENNVVNTGDITAGRGGISLFDLNADNVINTGTITAGTFDAPVDGEGPFPPPGAFGPQGDGLTLVNVDLKGVIQNHDNGVINAAGRGISIIDGSAQALSNTGSVTAGGHGLGIYDTDIYGNIYNNGSVTAGVDAIRVVDTTVGMINDGESIAGTGYIISDSNGVINADDDGIRVKRSLLAGGIENFGAINAGENGIDIDDTRLSGHLLNAGSIVAGTTAIDIGGEDSDGTVYIDGKVANYGAITAAHSGIRGEDVELNGDVLNAGSIITDGMADGMTAGIGLTNVKGVGNLINDGGIHAGKAGGDGNIAFGMGIQDAEMDGNVENNGVILANGYGIAVDNVEGADNVINSGGIQTTARGVYLVNSELSGAIENQADGEIYTRYSAIYVENVEAGSLTNSGSIEVSEGHGIKVLGSTVLNGNISNSGSVKAGHHGISLDTVEVDSVVNTGAILAGFANPEGNGVEIDNSTLAGVVANGEDGTIKANAHGMAITDTDGVTDFYNAGTLEAGAHGMVASVVRMDGDVTNSGTISTQGVDGAPFTVAMGVMDVEGLDNFTNSGEINAGLAEGESNIALGMAAMNVDMDGEIVNTGSISSSSYGVYLDQVRGASRLVNEGSLSAPQSRGISVNNTIISGELRNSGSIDSLNSGIYLLNSAAGYLNNSGAINVSEGHGIKVIGGGFAGGVTNDTGATLTAGHHGISLDQVTLVNGSLLNRGAIVAGTANAEGNGMEAFNSTINGLVVNADGATIDAAAGGIVLDNTTGVTNVVNAGTISAGGVGITVANTAVSGVTQNTGTVSGGAFSGVISQGDDTRDVETQQLAFDLRTQANPVKLENTGIINGDILGRSLRDELGDVLTLAGGELNGDVHDIEETNVTGTISLNNTFFSFNNSSTLTVTETGSLQMGDTSLVSVQGGYQQVGQLIFEVDEASRPFTQAIVDVTDVAEIADGSAFEMSLKNNDLRSLNPVDGAGRDIVLVEADNGATVDVDAVTITDNTILLNTLVGQRDSDRQVVANVSVADTGLLAASGGADVNAQNAIRALQATNSEGLIELYDSNRALYDQLFEGSATDFADFAERLVASPETGIAAGQSAQAEAVNTILTRIAELRTGAAGISAGDDEDAGTDIRPDSLWIRAIYSDGKQDATRHNGSDFNEYSLRSSGFTIGADKDVSDTLTLGVGVTLANSTANERGSRQGANSETKTVLGSVYAGWRDQDYFADASVSMGKGSTDLNSTEWEADYDSSQIGVSVLAGKSILFNNNDTLVEPRVGLNYTRLKSDKYSYEGATGTETIGSQNLETLELGAGVRLVTGIEMGDALLLPEASLMAWHDFKADGVEVDVAFETGGGSFTYFGPETEKTRYQAGVGAEYLMDNNFSVSVNYEHNWQDGFKADTVVAKLRYDF